MLMMLPELFREMRRREGVVRPLRMEAEEMDCARAPQAIGAVVSGEFSPARMTVSGKIGFDPIKARLTVLSRLPTTGPSRGA